MPISAYNWVLGSSIDSAIGSTSKAPDLRDINYGYKYPKKLSLKPGTEQHDRLKDAILNRAINARGCIQSRFDSWNIGNTLRRRTSAWNDRCGETKSGGTG